MKNTSLNGATDLHFAAQAGSVIKVAREVRKGTNINVQDDAGNTPLKYASAEPHVEVVRKLIELGASITLADNRGFTPLHCAAGHGFWPEALEIADLLLSHGAEINLQSHELGFVPLHEAKGEQMIRYLLSKGADPTIRNHEGMTPLEYMREQGENENAKHLAARLGCGSRRDDES